MTLSDINEGIEFDAADVDKFIDAYVTAMLWTERPGSGDAGDDSNFLDANYDADDLGEETRVEVGTETRAFLSSFGHLVWRAMRESGSRYTIEQAGHDFALTRNGHGAGFWDRGLGELGYELTRAAKSYGEVSWYLGDDNLIYQVG